MASATTFTAASLVSWSRSSTPRFGSVGCTGECLPCEKLASFASSTRKGTRRSRRIGDRYACCPRYTSCTVGCWHAGYRVGWKVTTGYPWHRRGSGPSTGAMSTTSLPPPCWTRRDACTARYTKSGMICGTHSAPCPKVLCGVYSAISALSPGF